MIILTKDLEEQLCKIRFRESKWCLNIQHNGYANMQGLSLFQFPFLKVDTPKIITKRMKIENFKVELH